MKSEEFINRSKIIHNNKYDYSLITSKECKKNIKVKIICPIHGIFEQGIFPHLRGQGCPRCAIELRRKKSKKTTKQFIKEAKNKYGNKYDYSLVNYVNNCTNIKIICRKHGIFEQKPNIFLNTAKYGCPKCAKEMLAKEKIKTTEQFIKEAKKIHNNFYDYSLANYLDSRLKVKIICPIHGMFEQIANEHLLGSGCPICKKSSGESKIQFILQNKKYIFEMQKQFNDLKDKKKLSYDFYIPDKKLLIEYNGRQHYEIIEKWGGYKKFLLQKHHDWLKRKYAQKNNIKLLTIPYWEKK